MQFQIEIEIVVAAMGVGEKEITKEQFKYWIEAALRAMCEIAVGLSIIDHVAHLQHYSITHAQIVRANTRNVILMIDSLARDQYRKGGIVGLSKDIIGKIHQRSECWTSITFKPVLENLIAKNSQKPKCIFSIIETIRRDASAHFPVLGSSGPPSLKINTEDLWSAYFWLKDMLLVWLSCFDPEYEWFDEQAIRSQVQRDLSDPILLPDSSRERPA